MKVSINNKSNGWSDFKIANAYADSKKYLKSCGYENFDVGLDLGCKGSTIKNVILDNYNPKKVFGFEPTPASYNETKNKYKNDKRIQVLDLAVSNKDGVAELYVNPNKSSGNSLRPHSKKQTIQVKTVRLDTWAKQNKINSFDVVKADIEGHELEALEGMGDLLGTVKVLIAEIRFSRRPTLYEKLTEYIHKYGLEIFTFIGIYFENNKISWGDAIFVKSK
jgi:FkbM family methyltransferase